LIKACASGGTGIRVRLRFVWSNPWRFKSSLAHNKNTPKGVFLLCGEESSGRAFVGTCKTFDSFMESTLEQKTEKVYRSCKDQDSSPAHKLCYNLQMHLIFLYSLEWALVFFLFIILFVMLVWMYSAITTKVPFISVPFSILPDIEKALDIQTDSVVYDLGCGDARVLRYLAKKNPNATFIGIENGVFPYYVAKTISWWNKKMGHGDNVQILREDFFKHDLSKATHIFVYLYPQIMDDILGKLEKELPPGARLVSATFKFTQKAAVAEIDLLRKKRQLARHLIAYEF
jgi:precorrin-6B methylase 2